MTNATVPTTAWGQAFIDRVTEKGQRPPDFLIGDQSNPQMKRWHIVTKNRAANVYLHHFLLSDEDRALHDHPWSNLSIILIGSYLEHTISAGGIHVRTMRSAGDWKLRLSGKQAHRIELINGPCWTLFMTGPKYRDWGFHCPKEGWIPWQRFTKPGESGKVGPGCSG